MNTELVSLIIKFFCINVMTLIVNLKIRGIKCSKRNVIVILLLGMIITISRSNIVKIFG